MNTYSGIDKKDFLRELAWHRKIDAITQGSYGESENGQWRGCAVACSLRSFDRAAGSKLRDEYDDHSEFETRGLWPEWLARLEDTIFEGLPASDALKWPERVGEAVPEGVPFERLDLVKWKFLAFLQKENIDRVEKLDIPDDLKTQVVDAIRGVLAVLESAIQTGVWDEQAAAYAARSAARHAASAAWSAASAAWSAESAARHAASAAWSAESAARSAESAARSAESAAWSAESAAFRKYADELIRLLKDVDA